MTGEALETLIFDLTRAFCKSSMPIGGRVYYRGLRPIAKNASSFAEDAVVSYLTGTDGDIQNGTCLVNVYVPDVVAAKSGQYLKDKKRCAQIADLLSSFPSFANKNNENVYFSKNDMIYTFPEEDIHQHFVSLKMDFKILNKEY